MYLYTTIAWLIYAFLLFWLLWFAFLAFWSLKIQAKTRTDAQLNSSEDLPRLAIIIPARNEELLIANAVKSVLGADYPEHLREVYVVADHCTDSTTKIALAAGAIVFERSDKNTGIGKAATLYYGLEQLKDINDYGGILLMDADCTLSRNYLQITARAFQAGAQVFGGEYCIADPDSTSFRQISHILTTLRYRLQCPALASMGIYFIIGGVCIAMRPQVLPYLNFDMATVSMLEDTEWSIAYMENDLPIRYDSEAKIFVYTPPTIAKATERLLRWDSPEKALKKRLQGLFVQGLASGKPRQAMSVLYLKGWWPPLSMLLALAVVGALAGTAAFIWTDGLVSLLAGIIILAGYMAYLMVGFVIASKPLSLKKLLLLFKMPVVAAWRLSVYITAKIRPTRVRDRADRTVLPEKGNGRDKISQKHAE